MLRRESRRESGGGRERVEGKGCRGVGLVGNGETGEEMTNVV